MHRSRRASSGTPETTRSRRPGASSRRPRCSIAFPAFQADANFLRFSTGGTVYSPIFRGFGAVGLRLGAIEPINGDPDFPQNLQIPYAYRFFAGGRTTHRAFYVDSLGIPGQTIIDDSPVGGNALILLNLEYRRRITGPLFAAIFVDAGNVWASPEQVNLGESSGGPGSASST